jgi:hypothetical protein
MKKSFALQITGGRLTKPSELQFKIKTDPDKLFRVAE